MELSIEIFDMSRYCFNQNMRQFLFTRFQVTVSTVMLNCCKGDSPSQWE